MDAFIIATDYPKSYYAVTPGGRKYFLCAIEDNTKIYRRIGQAEKVMRRLQFRVDRPLHIEKL